jgi:hypothetical protein
MHKPGHDPIPRLTRSHDRASGAALLIADNAHRRRRVAQRIHDHLDRGL